MKVIDYIKINGIENLKENFAIKVREYDDLYVLNYDQLKSPKLDPITVECRMLILDKALNIVSRTFDRFYNLNETPLSIIDSLTDDYNIYEKLDGSLISVYNYKGVWNIGTKSSAYGEFGMSRDNPKTFCDLVLESLKLTPVEFQENCNKYLDKNDTHIFELTTPENKVIKPYADYSLSLLAVRNKLTGNYKDNIEYVFYIGDIKRPKKLQFNSLTDCVNSCKKLKGLDEGYVIYYKNKPLAKLKSILYLVTVYTLEQGVKKEKLYEIILANEQDEFLTYFPEHQTLLDECINKYNNMLYDFNNNYNVYSKVIDQKEFAQAIMGLTYKSVYFTARKTNKTPLDVFNEMTLDKQINVLVGL